MGRLLTRYSPVRHYLRRQTPDFSSQLLSPLVSASLPIRFPFRFFLLSDVRSLTSETVRLACVRHAASVRPEPGSNSLKMILKQPSGCSNQFQSSIAHSMLAHLLYFFVAEEHPQVLYENLSKKSQGSLFVSLFNFQGPLPLKERAFRILPHPRRFVNTFFQPVRFFFPYRFQPALTFPLLGCILLCRMQCVLARCLSGLSQNA